VIGEQQSLCPCEEVLAHEHELEPDSVGREGAERQVTQAAVLRAADRVLDAGALAVDLLEPCDARAGLVGDEDPEAVPVMITERELRAGVGPLAAADRARPSRPGREVEIRKLSDPAPSRGSSSAPSAGCQADSGRRRIAARTGSVRSKPTVKRSSSSLAVSVSRCVAPPESQRTSTLRRSIPAGSCSSARQSTST
jgi:hypothetical protein